MGRRVAGTVAGVLAAAVLALAVAARLSPGPERTARCVADIQHASARIDADVRFYRSVYSRLGLMDTYVDGKGLRKVVLHGYDGHVTELYLTRRWELIYAHEAARPGREAAAGAAAGDRYYFGCGGRIPFGGNRMFRWTAPDGTPVDRGSRRFGAAERRLLRATRHVDAALGGV